VRRAVLTAAGASTLAFLLVLAACPSLGDIGGGSDGSTTDHVADGGTVKEAGDASCDANLGSDPHNCGRCGHDCLGGACAGGACEPVLLYTGNTPTSIVVDGPKLYVTVVTPEPSKGYVVRCTTTGDCATDNTVLAGGLDNPWFGVLQDASVYWADFSGLDATTDPGSVMGCPENGCPDAGPTVYSPDGGGIDGGGMYGYGVYVTGLTADPTYIYWAGFEGVTGAIFRCVPGECSGTLAPLVEGFGVPYGVAVDPSYVYWINIGTNVVHRCALPSCGGGPQIFAPITLAGGHLGLCGMALYEGEVYWTENVAEGGVFECPSTGCGTTPKAMATGQGSPTFIAVDDSGVYWTNNTGGTVMHCPASGCAEPGVFATTPSPFAIALDSVSVYYTSSPGFYGAPGLGKVFRIAK
jgi:hypothetical protein